jgi:hypothetical protein
MENSKAIHCWLHYWFTKSLMFTEILFMYLLVCITHYELSEQCAKIFSRIIPTFFSTQTPNAIPTVRKHSNSNVIKTMTAVTKVTKSLIFFYCMSGNMTGPSQNHSTLMHDLREMVENKYKWWKGMETIVRQSIKN